MFHYVSNVYLYNSEKKIMVRFYSRRGNGFAKNEKKIDQNYKWQPYYSAQMVTFMEGNRKKKQAQRIGNTESVMISAHSSLFSQIFSTKLKCKELKIAHTLCTVDMRDSNLKKYSISFKKTNFDTYGTDIH